MAFQVLNAVVICDDNMRVTPVPQFRVNNLTGNLQRALVN